MTCAKKRAKFGLTKPEGAGLRNVAQPASRKLKQAAQRSSDLSGQRKRHCPGHPFPLGVERHRLAATAFEWGSTGLILGHPFQAEDEVGQD